MFGDLGRDGWGWGEAPVLGPGAQTSSAVGFSSPYHPPRGSDVKPGSLAGLAVFTCPCFPTRIPEPLLKAHGSCGLTAGMG